jgi:hypothetical protein
VLSVQLYLAPGKGLNNLEIAHLLVLRVVSIHDTGSSGGVGRPASPICDPMDE